MKKNWFSSVLVFMLVFVLLASACTVQVESDGAIVARMAAPTPAAPSAPAAGSEPSNMAATTVTTDTVTTSATETATTTVVTISDLPDTAMMTIGEIVESVDNFSMLATAVDTTGMGMALTADGPLTLFVPSDAAFAAVPPQTLNELLADPVALTEILQYHLVVDQTDSTELARLDVVQTAAGQPLTVTIGMDGGLLVDGAQIVYADIPAANGVIHVINQILTPPTMDLALPVAAPDATVMTDEPADETLEELKQADTSGQTVVDVINSISGLTTAATAIDAAGLTEALAGPGPFTLFVPTDPAFRDLPDEQLQTLLNDGGALADLLRYHLVLDNVNSADLATLPSVLTASGEELVITVQENGRIFVNGAPVYQADIEAVNGVIHVIGEVLMPPTDSMEDVAG
ncbi:MAG: fasciclin domain-containing protein [Caldilineaceae bacterium]